MENQIHVPNHQSERVSPEKSWNKISRASLAFTTDDPCESLGIAGVEDSHLAPVLTNLALEMKQGQ